MNMIDVIEELMKELGVSQADLSTMRNAAMALYLKTSKDRELASRELTQEEIDGYRGLARLYTLAAIVSPEMREQIKKKVDDTIKRN